MNPTDRPPQVLLASMPFGVLNSPSLALGILQARLRAAGIAAECRHFTIDYAARIGVEAYNRIAGGLPRTTSLLGEWIFSHALHPRSPAQQETYLREIFGDEDRTFDHIDREMRIKSIEQILRLAAEAGDFVDCAANEILAGDPTVVGLTSVFEQNLASIALARRLRTLAPHLVIIMGGANCEGEMGRELARRYPFVDLVISGEADRLVVPLVAGLSRRIDWPANESLHPVIDADASAGSFLQARMIHDLEDQPRPDFDSYFEDLARHPAVAGKVDAEIPMESSRGCWWGAKHHCTFCGLNGATMSFRSKPPDAVASDVRAYAAKYPGRKIAFVDNIMDRGYYATLLPELARHASGVEIFYEIKSNVSRGEVQALHDAGVRHIQPGIESLSDNVLRLMRKGVSTLQNLQLLKWCMELGIRADWNILWGFPGERPADYDAMTRLVPWLTHLEPPARGTRIRLDRHSPNFRQAELFGFRRLRPYPSYQRVYDDLPKEAVANLAYFFEADHDLDRDLDGYTAALKSQIDAWRREHRSSTLFYLEDDRAVVVLDSRPHLAERKCYTLSPLASKLVMLCDTGQSEDALAKALPGESADRIRAELDMLCGLGIVWSDGRKYLSLAVSLVTYLQSRHSARLERGIDDMIAAA
jgi:ribosomal peptide maturation radical SAM protein 1